MKHWCRYWSTCSCTARTTASGLCPRFWHAMPPAKSSTSLPSASHRVAPSARATTKSVLATPRGTKRSRASRTVPESCACCVAMTRSLLQGIPFARPRSRRANGTANRRHRTGLSGRDDRRPDHLPRLGRRLVGGALLAPEGLHARVHDRARLHGEDQAAVRRARREDHRPLGRPGRQALRFFFNDTATTEIYTLFLHDAPR